MTWNVELIPDADLSSREQEMLLAHDVKLHSWVARNPRLSTAAQRVLLSQPSRAAVVFLAANPALDPRVQESLLKAESSIRGSLAMNPSLSVACIEALAGDVEPLVRERVAEHPGLPVGLLMQLAKDPDWTVRSGVTKNPTLGGRGASPAHREVQVLLSHDADWSVRLLLGARESSPLRPKHVKPLEPLQWGPDLSVMLSRAHFEAEYSKAVSGLDVETLKGLQDDWKGSVASLVEACQLTLR